MTKYHHDESNDSLDTGPSLEGQSHFDVHLNMALATVVSSYDDQSKGVCSSAVSLPPDVDEERKLQQQQRQEQLQQARRSSERRSVQHDRSDQESQQSPPPSPKPPLKTSVARTDPLRYYNLVLLSNAFFLVGSALFIGSSYNEYDGESNNHRSGTFLTIERDSEEQDNPSGYHLKLSTSIDTYVTRQMTYMLGATFCFLQVGFINVVRTPLDKFHFFQILAGFFGLLSAMFWETQSILSDIGYFFFVHAMTGQALLLLHSHWRRLVKPILAELSFEKEADERMKLERENRPQRRFTLSPLQQQQGHFAFDSFHSLSENPSGLIRNNKEDQAERFSMGEKSPSDGGYSFSIENSYSMEELDSIPGQASEEDGRGLQRETGAPINTDEEAQSEASTVLTNADKSETQQVNNQESVMLKFGFLLCAADSIFVLGSLIETALTYLTILVLHSKGEQHDEASQKRWNATAQALILVPGILWLGCAILTLLSNIWLRSHYIPVQVPKPNLRRASF